MNNKYKKLIENLQKACEFLGWEFSLDTNLIDRADVEDGIAFTIDKIEYMVATNGAGYYTSFMVQYHGNRDEPPSEDEQAIDGDNVTHADSLVSRILQAHWQVRFQWVMESLVPEEQG